MSSRLRIGIVFLVIFGSGAVGAAAISGAFSEAKVCADALGGYGMTVGDRFADETAEDAVRNFVESGIKAPELLVDDGAIAIDSETLIATLSEDGRMVAWLQLEPTPGGGFTIGFEAYCTDGDNGPFLAKSFDPSGRVGMEAGALESS